MINVYLDPMSPMFLSNDQFSIDQKLDRDNILLRWWYLKNYCKERRVNLNTIDLWDKNKATKEDVYVSFDYKPLHRKLYWRIKNKRYPIVNLGNFKKRILFQFESPTITPWFFKDIDYLVRVYDMVFSWCKFPHPKCEHFQIPTFYNKTSSIYWNNPKKEFLLMVNSNKKRPRSSSQKATKDNHFFYYQELSSERLKFIKFFSQTNEIDLYGYGWDKRPFFPYWFYKKAIKKVYKGTVKDRFQIMSRYKFYMCFENGIAPGYISEKIFDCFYVGTIPIYLGAPNITDYIPKNCFIDMRDFKNYEELRKFLKSLTDSEIETYRKNILKFLESEKFIPFTKEYFAERFVKIIKE